MQTFLVWFLKSILSWVRVEVLLTRVGYREIFYCAHLCKGMRSVCGCVCLNGGHCMKTRVFPTLNKAHLLMSRWNYYPENCAHVVLNEAIKKTAGIPPLLSRVKYQRTSSAGLCHLSGISPLNLITHENKRHLHEVMQLFKLLRGDAVWLKL